MVAGASVPHPSGRCVWCRSGKCSVSHCHPGPLALWPLTQLPYSVTSLVIAPYQYHHSFMCMLALCCSVCCRAVALCLTAVCMSLNSHLPCRQRKMQANAEKYPADLCRGSSAKYTSYNRGYALSIPAAQTCPLHYLNSCTSSDDAFGRGLLQLQHPMCNRLRMCPVNMLACNNHYHGLTRHSTAQTAPRVLPFAAMLGPLCSSVSESTHTHVLFEGTVIAHRHVCDSAVLFSRSRLHEVRYNRHYAAVTVRNATVCLQLMNMFFLQI